MPDTKKLSLMALLSAMALGIFVLESQIPAPVPIPGVKLGLANIITLVTMLLLGRKEAAGVLIVRVVLGSMFAGSPASFIYSACGAAVAYAIMCLTVGMFSKNQLWIVSALAALGHNAGQLGCCALMVKTPGILAYAPILAVSAVVTGVFTGLAAMYLLRALEKLRR